MNGPLPVSVSTAADADFAEIAAALGTTQRAVEGRAKRGSWPYREQPGRGGKKRLFTVATLPTTIKSAVIARRMETAISSGAGSSLPTPSPAVQPAAGFLIPIQASHTLTDKQRNERDARKGVLAAIRRLQANSGCSQEAAMTTLLTTAQSGKLEPALDALLRLARDRRGRAGDGYPSIRTLKRWLKAPDLAPKVSQKEMTVPAWAPALMKLYGQPQKPSLADCIERLPAALPAGSAAPSYHAARRFLDKLGNVERQRGRMLPRELKSLLPFVRRDASSFTPDAIYTADGHKFDAEVSHPKHGRAFRPEITTILSVPTRRCVGWSAGLSENTWAVMDALRHAVESSGIPMIWYVDNGCGYKNAAMTQEVTGFAGRLGISIEHSLPYNSQARGLEERSHKSIWVRGAKKLPTYMGADMDREARQRVFKLTRAHLRDTGRSPLLMEWPGFLAWCQGEIDAYNARPHRGLPKIRDAATGKKRHMSPNDAWQAALDERWEPMTVTAQEADDLFRPEIVAKNVRGEVKLFGNTYFSYELKEFTGDKVRVGYDIHDAQRVWVRDMDGRLICTAGFEANKRLYFPDSVADQAERRRAQAREKLLGVHLQEVRDELNPPALLEHHQAFTLPMHKAGDLMHVDAEICIESTEIGTSETEKSIGNVLPMPGMEARPWFTNDPDQYRWLMKNPAQWTAGDAEWLLDYAASEDYADLANRYDFQGVAWRNEDEDRAKAKLEDLEVAAR